MQSPGRQPYSVGLQFECVQYSLTMNHLPETEIDCPYCGEAVEIAVESDLAGEMVWDCEVCCRPWRLIVHREGSERQIEVRTLED